VGEARPSSHGVGIEWRSPLDGGWWAGALDGLVNSRPGETRQLMKARQFSVLARAAKFCVTRREMSPPLQFRNLSNVQPRVAITNRPGIPFQM
jgi:hypothetical protein